MKKDTKKKKAKIGRPCKSAVDKRSASIKIQLTLREYELLQCQAKAKKCSIAKLLRDPVIKRLVSIEGKSNVSN